MAKDGIELSEYLRKHLGKDKAIIVGHDWGGFVAWTFAMTMPEMTDKLIILNLPHPRGLAHELATNPQQQKNSVYARNFQNVTQWAAAVDPTRLMPTLRRLQEAHFHLTPETSPIARRGKTTRRASRVSARRGTRRSWRTCRDKPRACSRADCA